MSEDINYKDLLIPYRLGELDNYLDAGDRAILFALEAISLQLNAIGMMMVENRKVG